ncbi:hypothetical protein CYMTET_52514 [Cymbomonas tetramitiformis]|uniref:Uncharacterized protein n=1 Tax=Cymbomonas tetramitiformis TaxID=36881 RepID=A0AAE0BK02_9CHLO|nr:hypothetical protein CYMTET_52514 [Cymbomonas tetramitiformis]
MAGGDGEVKYPTRESQLQELIEKQTAMMQTMAEALNDAMKLNAERRESVKSSDHEEAESGVTSLGSAQKTDTKGLGWFSRKSIRNKPSSQAEEGDDDGEDGESIDDSSFITVPGSTSVASEVLSAILKQVTAGDAFDVVRQCGNDGLKAFRKLRCRVEPQLFGQLACSMKKL